MTHDAARKRLLRLVAGQVRSHMSDHPEFYTAKIQTRTGRKACAEGIAKRVVGEILAWANPTESDSRKVAAQDAAHTGLHTDARRKDPSAVVTAAADGHDGKGG